MCKAKKSNNFKFLSSCNPSSKEALSYWQIGTFSLNVPYLAGYVQINLALNDPSEYLYLFHCILKSLSILSIIVRKSIYLEAL